MGHANSAKPNSATSACRPATIRISRIPIIWFSPVDETLGLFDVRSELFARAAVAVEAGEERGGAGGVPKG
jgi:CHASE1-domain containing sensor protein